MTPCNSGYDGNDVCETFWYDEVDDTTYVLTSSSNTYKFWILNADMAIWSNGDTVPDLFFKGADLSAQASISKWDIVYDHNQ